MAKTFRFDGLLVHCACSETWPTGIVERFDGGGGENVIFFCHFCGKQWLTTHDKVSEGTSSEQEVEPCR